MGFCRKEHSLLFATAPRSQETQLGLVQLKPLLTGGSSRKSAPLIPRSGLVQSALSTLPDYVVYPCANPVFPANARSRTRHSIDSFHQPHCRAKESTAKCIIASQVLPPSAAASSRRHRSRGLQGPGRPGNCLGPDSANDSSPPEESVADIRLCRAICWRFARDDRGFPG